MSLMEQSWISSFFFNFFPPIFRCCPFHFRVQTFDPEYYLVNFFQKFWPFSRPFQANNFSKCCCAVFVNTRKTQFLNKQHCTNVTEPSPCVLTKQNRYLLLNLKMPSIIHHVRGGGGYLGLGLGGASTTMTMTTSTETNRQAALLHKHDCTKLSHCFSVMYRLT